jgi:transcription initiation factor TFIIIB Brf1 subunit/transcription initiation factor TFIIB
MDNIIEEFGEKEISMGEEFTTHHNLFKGYERSIRAELDKLELPQDIKITADEIFHQMKTGTKRGDKRKQMIFHCVRNAYIIHGLKKDPKQLADICGIDYSKITKASSMCSQVQTGFISPIIEDSPIDFIHDMFDNINKVIESQISFADGTVDKIIKMGEEVLKNDMEDDGDLSDEKPQMVAIAIILYYLEIMGITINQDKYKELFKTTFSTIKKLKIKVEVAYNK